MNIDFHAPLFKGFKMGLSVTSRIVVTFSVPMLLCLMSCGTETDGLAQGQENEQQEKSGRPASSTRESADTPLDEPSASTTITLENLPAIDGSDSTEPLRSLLICRELGVDCEWMEEGALTLTWRIMPTEGLDWYRDFRNNNTHSSFQYLIDDKDELIITARGISRDEQEYANEKGVELLSRPIAKDAFVFIVNADNLVRNLTIEQVKKIYMGEITSWKEVGGNDAPIKPFVRNANSGSQEKMETLVMDGLTMPDWSTMTLWNMISPYSTLYHEVDGICYTPYYYYKYIVRSDKVRALSLEGIEPNATTIAEGTYPYVTEVMAIVRSDEDRSSTAYQMFYKLATGGYNDIIDESGYISLPNNDPSGIIPVYY